MTVPAGILDTCVVIELGGNTMDESLVPDEQAITAVTLGELSVGPLIADSADERANRQLRLQAVELQFAEATLPYDPAAARIFGRIMAGALQSGRSSRVRVGDYQIAAVAIANDLPLYTINVKDFAAIGGLDLRAVPLRP
jgi:tRNA(fMet)-specific endonuclease VapC